MNRSTRQGFVAVTAVVVIGLVIGLVVALTGSDDGRGAPTSAPSGTSDTSDLRLVADDEADRIVSDVQGYYAAIRSGDATKALSYGPAAPDDSLLTDAVLAKQRAIAPITTVRVDHDILVLRGRAVVDVVVTVGGRAHDESIDFVRAGGRWRMKAVAAEVGITGTGSPTLEIFGKTVESGENVYLFPGGVPARSKTPGIELTGGTTGTATVPGASDVFPDLTWRLTKDGISRVRGAVRAALEKCALIDTLRPDDPACPNRSYGVPDEGTVRWTAPTDYSSLRVDTGGDDGPSVRAVGVDGTLTFGLTYRDDGKMKREKVAADLIAVSVDLTTSPATYNG